MLALVTIMDNSLLFYRVLVMFIMVGGLNVDVALLNDVLRLFVNRHELVLGMVSHAMRLLFHNSGGVKRCLVVMRIMVRHFFLVGHNLVVDDLVMRSFLVHDLGLFNILVVMLRLLMEVI